MSWLRIRELVRKEFIQLFREKKNLPLLFVAPFIQLIVFGYAATLDLNDIPIAIYNEDSSAASRDLIAGFRGSPNFHEVEIITHNEQIESYIS